VLPIMNVVVGASAVGGWAGDPLMKESEAAQILEMSKRTLQKWRLTGGGPEFLKVGRAMIYSIGFGEMASSEPEAFNFG
jgi:hypothetical protein